MRGWGCSSVVEHLPGMSGNLSFSQKWKEDEEQEVEEETKKVNNLVGKDLLMGHKKPCDCSKHLAGLRTPAELFVFSRGHML